MVLSFLLDAIGARECLPPSLNGLASVLAYQLLVLFKPHFLQQEGATVDVRTPRYTVSVVNSDDYIVSDNDSQATQARLFVARRQSLEIAVGERIGLTPAINLFALAVEVGETDEAVGDAAFLSLMVSVRREEDFVVHGKRRFGFRSRANSLFCPTF